MTDGGIFVACRQPYVLTVLPTGVVVNCREFHLQSVQPCIQTLEQPERTCRKPVFFLILSSPGLEPWLLAELPYDLTFTLT